MNRINDNGKNILKKLKFFRLKGMMLDRNVKLQKE